VTPPDEGLDTVASDLDRHAHDMTRWEVVQRTYGDSVPVTAAAVVTQNAAVYFISTVSLFGSLVACKRCHSMPARSKSRSRACNNEKKKDD
jgi:hypothetical protein